MKNRKQVVEKTNNPMNNNSNNNYIETNFIDMKKIFLFVGACALLVGASCSKTEEQVNTDSIKNVQLTAELEQATDYKDSLLLIMDDIYGGLDQIQQQENLISNMSQSPEGDKRTAVREDLEVIRQRLASNRKLLNQMQKKLNTANDKNGMLAKTIDNLQAHIAQQETKIAQLNTDLENMRAENAQLKTEVTETKEQLTNETQLKEQAQQQVVATENQMNKCYFAIGSNSELKSKDLISKKFLGSTKVMQGDFDTSYFQTADKRNLKSIPCNNKKVKIWTNHPAGSYELIESANGNKTIRILNSDKFWSLSNHLIIQVG